MNTITTCLALAAALSAADVSAAASTTAVPAGQWRSFDTALEPGNGAPCCMDVNRSKARGGLCELDADSWTTDRDQPADDRLRVFLHADAEGRIDRVRAFGASCALGPSAAGVASITLDPTAQVVLLKSVALDNDQRRAREGAIATLALLAGEHAGQALVDLSTPGYDDKVRRDALFWLTQSRGQVGFEAVNTMLQRPGEPRGLRKHAVFALSQSEVAGRDSALVALSRADSSTEIRGEALFWLAQVSPAAAEPALLEAVHADSHQLRDKAIFGLSQLPDERAVATLSKLAADRSLSRETRKQALFWLTQSNADKAMPEVDRLLGVKD